ncbi:hypothetical protein [Burkholderia sp. PR2]|uniref:hypothetical protein n=1 Tax=Burkholderia sp. PR2 TaxID=3448078 RepID=UPI00402ACD88
MKDSTVLSVYEGEDGDYRFARLHEVFGAILAWAVLRYRWRDARAKFGECVDELHDYKGTLVVYIRDLRALPLYSDIITGAWAKIGCESHVECVGRGFRLHWSDGDVRWIEIEHGSNIWVPARLRR